MLDLDDRRAAAAAAAVDVDDGFRPRLYRCMMCEPTASTTLGYRRGPASRSRMVSHEDACEAWEACMDARTLTW